MDRLSVDNKFKDFENNLSNLFSAFITLKKESGEKDEEIKELKLRISALSDRIKKLNEENRDIKLVNAMQGNEEYTQQMKIKLNKLIHEVDICMGQIVDL